MDIKFLGRFFVFLNISVFWNNNFCETLKLMWSLVSMEKKSFVNVGVVVYRIVLWVLMVWLWIRNFILVYILLLSNFFKFFLYNEDGILIFGVLGFFGR